MSTDPIENLRSIDPDNVSTADLRAALRDAGHPQPIKADRAALLATLADILSHADDGDPDPVTIGNVARDGRPVYVDPGDARTVARRAIAERPNAATDAHGNRDGLDGDALALALVTGYRPVGRKRDVFAGLRGPGEVQTVARWALATVDRHVEAVAVPVRRVPTAGGNATEFVADRVTGAKGGGLKVAPGPRAVAPNGTLYPCVGYMPHAAVTAAGAAVVAAMGIPGVSAGRQPSRAVEAVEAWSVGWTATDDDGSGQIEGAIADAVEVARQRYADRLTGDARDAARDGRALAIITRAAARISDSRRGRAVKAAERARSVRRVKVAPIA